MVAFVDSTLEKSFTQDEWFVHSPVDTEYSFLYSSYKKVKSTRAMNFKSLINTYNVNDITRSDEISLVVYSDAVGQMFKCGQYALKAGDLVDFKDLTVPCHEMVAVTLVEFDGKYNDGHTVMIPCKP